MLPHIKDQAPNSLPASRVALSARLSLLAVPSLLKSLSRPGTPSTPGYVASSLNPSRNTPISVTDSKAEDASKFENLSLIENIRKFENVLGSLSHSISSFERDQLVESVRTLIGINDDISFGIEELEKHRKLGEQASVLGKTNEDLDLQAKHILRELISCRALLKQLSSLPASKDQQLQALHSVDVNTLIEYSMKLAKFSKTPATVQSPFIHPNNFVWPAEDALRRGMLAMASLKPDALINAEFGVPEADKGPESPAEDVEMEEVVAESKPVARAGGPKPAAKKPAPDLDLDLFDSGDDSD